MDEQKPIETTPTITSTTPTKVWFDTPKAIVVGALILAIGIAVGLSGGMGGALSDDFGGGNGNAPQEAQQIEADVMVELGTLAKKFGVDKNDFVSCMESDIYLEKITRDEQFVMDQGTPYNLITNPKGTLTLGGALPYEQFNELITRLMTDETFTIPEELKTTIDAEEFVIRDTDYVRGSVNAPIKIFEYSDIDCPYCQVLHPTLTRLIDEQSDTVAWIYRHHPLDGLHPFARTKAEAAECIANLSTDRTATFWKYLDAIMNIR